MHSLFPCNLRLSHTVCLQFHFSPAHYASVKMRLESHHLDVEQLQEDSFLQPHKFLQNFEIFSIIGTIDYIFFYYIMKKPKATNEIKFLTLNPSISFIARNNSGSIDFSNFAV